MAEGESESFSSTIAGGSDFLLDNICDPCERRGFQDEAVGYCRDCWDYLCTKCYKTHLEQSLMKDHVLLDKDHMPQRPKCDLCILEGKQLGAEGFCNDCGDYLCKECFRTHLKPRPLRNHVLLDKSKMPIMLQDRDEDEKTRAEYVDDILVKSDDDETLPFITGCTVLPGDKLVLADMYNSKVKLVDLTCNSLSAQLKLPTFLWDVTKVNKSQVAITCCDTEAIYIVNVTDSSTLELDHKIDLDGQGRGIASMAEKLIVSYVDPVKVDILSLTGKLIKSVVAEDQTNGPKLKYPLYITTDAQAKSIYIADECSHKIIRMSITGNVLATFNIEMPRGITVDKTGALYVCGKQSDRITQISGDLTQMRELTLLYSCDEGYNSICYCDVTDRLYIGSSKLDTVEVYQLKSDKQCTRL